MLPVLSAPIVPGIELLQKALLAESEFRTLRLTNPDDLRFDKKNSQVSSFPWTNQALRELARSVHPALARVADKFPESAVKGCINSCAPSISRRIEKFGLNTVLKNDRFVHVAGWRSLQIKPSQIIQSLVRHRFTDILVEYAFPDLTVIFPGKGMIVRAVRTNLAKGWALERATGHRNFDNEIILGDFSRWVIADWDSALFVCRSHLCQPSR